MPSRRDRPDDRRRPDRADAGLLRNAGPRSPKVSHTPCGGAVGRDAGRAEHDGDHRRADPGRPDDDVDGDVAVGGHGPTTSTHASALKPNQSGSKLVLEANGQFEIMAWRLLRRPQSCRRLPLHRRRNATVGPNDWYAGDAVFNTGTTGDGFIDLYSVAGVHAATYGRPDDRRPGADRGDGGRLVAALGGREPEGDLRERQHDLWRRLRPRRRRAPSPDRRDQRDPVSRRHVQPLLLLGHDRRDPDRLATTPNITISPAGNSNSAPRRRR